MTASSESAMSAQYGLGQNKPSKSLRWLYLSRYFGLAPLENLRRVKAVWIWKP
jgi:hypothetical protein